eukprot:102139-Amphidinium_carterae.1
MLDEQIAVEGAAEVVDQRCSSPSAGTTSFKKPLDIAFMRAFKGQTQKAAGMNLAKEIVHKVSDIGALKSRPEMKLDLCHLVAHTCLQINTVERKNKAWTWSGTLWEEFLEFAQVAGSFHAR